MALQAKLKSAASSWRVAGLLMLCMASSGALVWGGERGRIGSRTHRDFGPTPENYSQLFDELDTQTEVRPRTPLRPLLPPKPRPSVPPIAPRQSPDAPTLAQKISSRYQDPRVIRVLTDLTSRSGESFFREVSQMIDTRHIEPSTYARRVDMAFDHLQLAVENSAFQSATGIRPGTREVQKFQAHLETMRREARVRTQADALNVMRQVGQLGQQSLGLNPAAVYFEFVYASLDTLDKFSMFLAPEKSGDVSLGLDQKLVGIGVEVEQDPAGLKILKAFPGGPAAQATLKKGDLITAVNGRSLQGLDLSRSVDLVTGPAGSPVKLSLRRDNLIADVTLVRQAVEVASLSEVRLLEEDSRVGYIKLDQFAESSTKELDAALWKLHNAGMESLVLDLRGNPGGYLTTAIEISDRFLPAGTIVSTRGRNADDNSQETAKFAETWRTPLVVLIDHQSASASEILAAAIQENGRGLIVGETSYGKGTVQSLLPLQSIKAGVRLTTAKFYSPEGREMAGSGVTPDIKVRAMDDDAAVLQAALDATRDPQLQSMANRYMRPNRTGMRTIQVSMTAMK